MWRKFFIGFEIMNAFNKIILSLYERGYHILLATVENIVTQRSLNAEVARLYFQLFFFVNIEGIYRSQVEGIFRSQVEGSQFFVSELMIKSLYTN